MHTQGRGSRFLPGKPLENVVDRGIPRVMPLSNQTFFDMKTLFTLLLAALCLPSYSAAQQAGALDSTFNQDGIVSIKINNLNSAFFRVRLQPDNKRVAFGYLKQNDFDYKAIAVRFAGGGSLDPTFGTDGVVIIEDIDAAGRQNPVDGNAL